jgi:histone deacetylase HOS3
LLGAAAAIAHLEASGSEGDAVKQELVLEDDIGEEERRRERERTPDVADLLGNLNISTTTPRKDTPRSDSTSNSIDSDSPYLHVPPVPLNSNGPERLLHTHPALQIIHTPASEHPSPPLPLSSGPATFFPRSEYLRKLTRWALEAPEKIKKGECEIPPSFTLSGPGTGTGGEGTREEETIELNQNDLYLAPGSVEAIEGCVSLSCVCYYQREREIESWTPVPARVQVRTVCQAVDLICSPTATPKYSGAFCTIRPPGHHCGPTTPSGFCYINNLLVSSLHAHQTYSQDRAVIIDFDLHHGNGTQEIVMGLNELGWAEDLLREGGKPERVMTTEEARSGRRGRGWKGFYGSVHDIVSRHGHGRGVIRKAERTGLGSDSKVIPVKTGTSIWSRMLASRSQRTVNTCQSGPPPMLERASRTELISHPIPMDSDNVHLDTYTSEADFYDRLYPKYLELLDSAERFLKETEADPERTTVFIRWVIPSSSSKRGKNARCWMTRWRSVGSAGFDACEHEYEAMQRHGRRVPVSLVSLLIAERALTVQNRSPTDLVLLPIYPSDPSFRRPTRCGENDLGPRRGV